MNKIFTLLLLLPIMIFAQGSLMLVGGGGEDYGDWSDLPYKWFVEQADSGIIINIDVDATADWYAGYFKSFGANAASHGLQISDKTIANDSTTYKTLIAAKGIFMEGGDQWDYVSTWKNTLVEEAIKKVYANGGVIGGTSAGLAVLGEVFFDAKFGSSYPDEAAENCRNNDIHLDNGLFDLMPGILTDSHFHPRGRMGRLIPMMAKWRTDMGENLVGIGVDDKTAFCIDENKHGIVYGKASVTIVKPTENSVCESISGKPVKYTNLRFDQLVHGVKYNMNDFIVINPEILNTYHHQTQTCTYNEMTLNGNDDGILSAGSVKVNRLTSGTTTAWYGNLNLSDGNNQIPNSVIINKIWDNNDYYENRFVGGLYAIAENPGITAIFLGENSTLNIDSQGNCTVGNYAYFVDSKAVTYYGFPQKNDPTAPIPNSNHPAIINATLHFLNDGCQYSLQDTTCLGIDKPESELPQKFKVGQNYPNPFNGETTIDYEIIDSGIVTFLIYNLKGGLIEQFSKEHDSSGYYHFKWENKSISTGIYLLKAYYNGRYSYTKKMIYLK